MIYQLAEDERLVQCGTVGWRRKDGSIERSEPIYHVVKASELTNGLTKVQAECCEDFAQSLGKLFGEYVEGMKKEGLK